MIPNAITVCVGSEVPVEQVEGLPECGHWLEEGEDSIVRIRKDQPEVAKIIVLMHEMIHMAESQLMAAGVLGWFYGTFIRRIWGEKLVENLSSFLFQWMALSGMLTGCTPEEAREFIETGLKDGSCIGMNV